MKKILSIIACMLVATVIYAGTTTNFNWNYGVRGQSPWWDVWTVIFQSIDTEVNTLKLKLLGYDDARRYASINAAVTAIGSTETTLVVSNSQTLTANLTIPSTLTLMRIRGGSITKASTYTLTINGKFVNPDNGQAFIGFSAGDVTFGAGAVKEVCPEWWGIDGTADQTEINIAIVAGNGAIPVRLLGKTYNTTAEVDMISGAYLLGSGMLKTIINNGGAGVAVRYNGSGVSPIRKTLLSDLKVINAGGGTDGIYLNYAAQNNTIERVWVKSAGRYGIYLYNTSFSNVIQNNIIDSSTSYGIYVGQECSATVITKNLILSNTIGIFVSDVAASCAAIRILDNDIESNTVGGIYISQVLASSSVMAGIEIVRNYLEGNTGYGIRLNSAQAYPHCPYGTRIEGNYISSTTPNIDLIQIDRAIGTVIKGNTLNSGAEATIDYISITDANSRDILIGKNSFIGSGNKYNLTVSTFFKVEEQATLQLFTASDTTPSVLNGTFFRTNNGVATVIEGFDNGDDGKVIRIKIGDVNTTIDFTGTTLKGNAGVDWTPTINDWMECVYDGTNWYCSVHDCTA